MDGVGTSRRQNVRESFGDFLDEYEKLNPGWANRTVLEIHAGALDSVVQYAEADGVFASGDHFVYEIRLEVGKVDPEGLGFYFAQIVGDSISTERMAELFWNSKNHCALEGYTSRVRVVDDGKMQSPIFPVDSIDHYKANPKMVNEALTPRVVEFNGTFPSDGGKSGRVRVELSTSPLILNLAFGVAYYPIVVRIAFDGLPRNRVTVDNKRSAILELVTLLRDQLEDEKWPSGISNFDDEIIQFVGNHYRQAIVKARDGSISRFQFTKLQALAMKKLADLQRTGNVSEIYNEDLAGEVGTFANNRAWVRDLFKSRPGVWGRVVVKGSRPGYVKLGPKLED